MDSTEVDQQLKQEFFDLWFSDELFSKPDLADPEFVALYEMLTKYAKMERAIFASAVSGGFTLESLSAIGEFVGC